MWWRRLCVGIALAAVLGFYGWTVRTTGYDLRLAGERADYYNLLLDGFQEGHLWMKAEPDPALLALPEKERPGGAPFMLDASLYQGKYYLYFGVVPVVTLYWPFQALVGRDLPETWALLFYAAMALGFASAWWSDVRATWFPRLGGVWCGLIILAIGWGTALPSTLRRPLFYEVAITAGLAWSLVALWAVGRAWRSQRGANGWLLVAGLASGLATGSRANLLPALVVLLLVGVVGVIVGRSGRSWRAWRGPLVAVILGAGVIGGGLAAYNYARFGDVKEFGHTYQLGVVPKKMFRTTNFVHNLRLYYFEPPVVQAYFPFVAPASEPPKPEDYVGREHAHGEWVWWPAVIVAGVGVVILGRRRLWPRGLGWALAAAGVLFGGNLLVVCFTAVRANRYMLDFHPYLVLAVVTLLGALAALRGWGGWILRGLAGVGLIIVAGFNLLASMQVHGFFSATAPGVYRSLATHLDRWVWPWLPASSQDVGDRIVTVRWATKTESGHSSPLFVTGTSGFEDSIWVEHAGADRVRFMFKHWEFGEVHGAFFPITPGGLARVRISGGPLLPPATHPWYGEASAVAREATKAALRIEVDGVTRFERDVASFDSSVGLQRWGWMRKDDGAVVRFAGEITETVSAPCVVAVARPREQVAGAVRMRLEFSQVMDGWMEPLFQSGSQTAFDSLAVRYVRPGVIQFVHDQLGGGATASPEIEINAKIPHELSIDWGPMSDPIISFGDKAVGRVPSGALVVRLDGVEAFVSSVKPHAFTPGDWVAGVNRRQASGCRALFSEPMTLLPRMQSRGRVKPGVFALRWLERQDVGERGVLAAWRRADGETAAVVWRSTSEGWRVGWSEGGQTVWSEPVDRGHLENHGLHFVLPESGPGWVEIESGGRLLRSVRSGFFDGSELDFAGMSLGEWRGGGLGDGEVAETPVDPASPLGRVRLRFLVPANVTTGADPLLCVGVPGAADMVYLRALGANRWVFGLDHWGVGSVESEALTLAPDFANTLVVELGSLAPAGTTEPERVRFILNGRVVLDRTVALYPVKPDSLVVGGNPHGMSTAGPTFRGSMVSVRTRLPE